MTDLSPKMTVLSRMSCHACSYTMPLVTRIWLILLLRPGSSGDMIARLSIVAPDREPLVVRDRSARPGPAAFMEPLLFAGGRERRCSQARGRLLPVAVVTGRNLGLAPVALALLLAVLAWFASSTRIAEAHASILESKPQSGARLSSSPGIVSITFSEPLNNSLSRATVNSPDGQHFDSFIVSPREMDVQVPTNAFGVYTVEWTTVSAVDGHVLHGSLRFGVGVSPGAGGPEDVSGPQSTDLLIAAARAAEYLALLTSLGMVVLAQLAIRPPILEWVRPRLWIPLTIALVAGIAVVAGEAMSATSSHSPSAVLAYLTNGLPGLARVTHLVAEALAVAWAYIGPRWALGWLLVALTALAASGHAAAAQPSAASISIDSLHLVAAGAWAGGILALATIRPPDGWLGTEGRRLLNRFSYVALPAFVLTALMGLLRATEEFTGPRDLVSSNYGRVFDVKVLAVGAMLPFSVLAWRRVRASPRLEGTVALVVIGASALLAAFPLPPARAQQADAAAAPSASNPALPTGGDLTLAGRAGNALVALTIRPAKPGPNSLWLYLLSFAGEQGANSLPLFASAGGTPVGFSTCGTDCRTSKITLVGGESLAVQVGGGSGGGTATFAIPPLPASDAGTLVSGMQRRMHALQTLRIDEQLGPSIVPVSSSYEMQAPDRMHVQVGNGFENFIIGGTSYSRTSAALPWRVQSASGSHFPFFIWDSSPILGPHVVGRASVDGVQTEIMAFHEGTGSSPTWFEVWVSADGLAYQSQMTAEAHFMDHRYYDFDTPISIQAPSSRS
jgi:copper transport protein